MINTPSPLDHLAAFAIVAVTAVIVTLGVSAFIDHVQENVAADAD